MCNLSFLHAEADGNVSCSSAFSRWLANCLFLFCFFVYFFLIRGGNAAKLFERVATLRSIINLLYISLCKTKCFVQNLAGIEDFFWLYRVTSDSTLHTFKEGGIFQTKTKTIEGKAE